MSTPCLTARGLSVFLRRNGTDVALVKDLDLVLEPGTITGLAGASGSGKSLTALALLGLLDPVVFRREAAELKLDGEDLLSLSSERQRALRGPGLAMVFQDPATALDPVTKIGRQLERVLQRQLDLDRPAAQAASRAALRAVGFQDPDRVANTWPHQLSGGMRQRVMIAHAQALEPRVLIADEPTTALDAHSQAVVLEQLERLKTEQQTAILLITHDLRLLLRHADKVLVMHEGHLVERTDPATLMSAPVHEQTTKLVESLPPPVAMPGPRKERPHDAPPAASEPALLEVRDLTVRHRRRWLPDHDSVPAVTEASIDLSAGEVLGLAGESGAGKSTLARTLLQLYVPATGSIRLDGQELVGASREVLAQARRRMQIVLQDPSTALSPRRSVRQLLEEPARHFGLDHSETRLTGVLADVELDGDALRRRPAAFSSGQRQRIALARALLCSPDLLIADEVLSALDVSVQEQVVRLLNRLCRERGIGLLLISHDLSVLQQIADRVAIMQQGRVVEQGATGRLLTAPAHDYSRSLITAQATLDLGR